MLGGAKPPRPSDTPPILGGAKPPRPSDTPPMLGRAEAALPLWLSDLPREVQPDPAERAARSVAKWGEEGGDKP